MFDPFDLLSDLSSTAFTSGAALAERRNVSRMAIWKAIDRLRSEGVPVNAVRGRGYRLARPIELLSPSLLKARLDPVTRTRVAHLDVFISVPSTNAHLMRQYGPRDRELAVCLAEHQSAGRGRRGRLWESPFGANLYLSVRRQFQRPASELALLSLAVAAQLALSLEQLGLAGHGIKWPNDLYWQGAKLGGLLLELAGETDGPCSVVVGLGLNLGMPRENHARIGQPVADLADAFGDDLPPRNEVAAELITALITACDQFEARGFGGYQAVWERFDLLTGREIDVHEADGIRHGLALGIDAAGCLRVQIDGQEVSLVSGEVSVRPHR